MTKEEYFKFHAECVAKMTDITRRKNADYTGAASDPFANFARVEALGICTTEQGFLTRMTDKLCRISSFAQKGELQVKDESVEDTLLDLANYAILLAGYIRSKKATDNRKVLAAHIPVEIQTEQLKAAGVEIGRSTDRHADWIAR